MGVISIAKSNFSDHFLSLSSWLLDSHYQIRFYSTVMNSIAQELVCGGKIKIRLIQD